jgi:hypothetical protein
VSEDMALAFWRENINTNMPDRNKPLQLQMRNDKKRYTYKVFNKADQFTRASERERVAQKITEHFLEIAKDFRDRNEVLSMDNVYEELVSQWHFKVSSWRKQNSHQ